jgi:hypothetical protein
VESLDVTQLIALAAVLGFASGIRLYAVLLITGLVGYAGWVELARRPRAAAASVGTDRLRPDVSVRASSPTSSRHRHRVVRSRPSAFRPARHLLLVSSEAWTARRMLPQRSWRLARCRPAISRRPEQRAANTSRPNRFRHGLSIAEDVGTAGLPWLVLTYPGSSRPASSSLVLAAAWLLPKLFRSSRECCARSGDNSGATVAVTP